MAETRAGEFAPNYASPPGDTIAEILEERGMSQAELALRVGMAAKTVNEIVKGKAPITPATAIKLEHVLGVPASFWNTREQQFREKLACQADEDRLADQISWLTEIPVKELIKRKSIPDSKDKAALVQNALKFFGVASEDQWKRVWKSFQCHIANQRSLKVILARSPHGFASANCGHRPSNARDMMRRSLGRTFGSSVR